jgi:hypothetical protein
MAFREAITGAVSLRDALAAEVERAREERGPIRELDADRLFDRAASRRAFLEEARRLEGELAGAVAKIARELGLDRPTLAELRRAAPAEAAPLCDAVEAVRRLAAELLEVDRVNRELVREARTCVDGYLTAVRPAPRGYDRRGLRPGAPELAGTVSRRL